MHDIRTFFDEHAVVWDAAFTPDASRIQAMLLLSDIQPGSVILDIGCGTGVLAPYLLAYSPSLVLGIDFSSGMIAQAVAKIQHEKVRFICADFYDMTDLQCDCCFLYNTFLHLGDYQQAISHLATLVRQGGRVTISHTQAVQRHRSQRLQKQPPSVHGIAALLEHFFHIDVYVDNNSMFLISGIRKSSD